MTSSYLWPTKPRHYFKHREHQHYFTISLADLFDFVSVYNVATLCIHYINFWLLPHTGDLQNQGITSNAGNINIISQFLLQICLILFQFTMLQLFPYTTWTFVCFLILVTFKTKALLQTQGTSTLFRNFSCRFVWFCFSSQWCNSLHTLHELFFASSYWWPSKPRHYFKHREHQHYFAISLADLFDFVSVHNGATLCIHYMNFCLLPHTGDLQNQGITSNTGNINIISQFLLQICLILFQFIMLLLLAYTTWTFRSFLILVK